MKKLKQIISAGLVGLVMAITPGCEFAPDQMQNWYLLNDSEIPKAIKNLEGKEDVGAPIHKWVIHNIHHKYYPNGFQPAQETLRTKEGNCANRALLTLALNYKITDGKSKGDLVYCLQEEGVLHYTPRIDGNMDKKRITQIYEVVPFDKIGEYIYWRQ